MFIKGMKYEIRSVSRIVVPMLIVFLCAAMIMSLGFMLDGRVFGFTQKAEESDTVLGALFAIAEGYGDREILEIASTAAAVSLRAQGHKGSWLLANP